MMRRPKDIGLADGPGEDRHRRIAADTVGARHIGELSGDVKGQRIVELHPDHVAAEYARLYLLDAATTAQRTDTAWDVAQRMLEETGDPFVLSQAVALMTTLNRRGVLPPEQLDWIGTLYDDFPELVDDVDVAALGLDHAMMHDDLARSRAWYDRFDQAVLELCDARGHSVECAVHQENLNASAAYIGDMDVVDARTWRQAFVIAGYECTRIGHDWQVSREYRTVVAWEDAWVWGEWEPYGNSYTDCLEDLVRQGPVPLSIEHFDVRLSILH